ncbi:MAG: class I SAM-dependent methyltransferase [Bacteroidota bacterium]
MKIIKKLIRKKIGYYKSRYQQLSDLFEEIRPKSMIEIGVWTGKRSTEFIKSGFLEMYHGFDLFEEITKEIQVHESMGTCHMVYKDDIEKKLRSVNSKTLVELHKGNTKHTLSDFFNKSSLKFDFILIDGGHSLETIDNDWKYCEKLLSDNGTCVFDDYYLNTDLVGCRRLIDSLDKNTWEVVFFKTIEKNIEENYLTMVSVTEKTK